MDFSYFEQFKLKKNFLAQNFISMFKFVFFTVSKWVKSVLPVRHALQAGDAKATSLSKLPPGRNWFHFD